MQDYSINLGDVLVAGALLEKQRKHDIIGLKRG